MAMASWRLFNNGVLGLILLNSIVLGMTDYDVLDCNCGSDKFGDPVVTGCQPWDPPLCETGYRPERVYSWRNHLGEATEPVFTVLFTIECAIRIVAMGFVGPRKMCSKLTAPSPPPSELCTLHASFRPRCFTPPTCLLTRFALLLAHLPRPSPLLDRVAHRKLVPARPLERSGLCRGRRRVSGRSEKSEKRRAREEERSCVRMSGHRGGGGTFRCKLMW